MTRKQREQWAPWVLLVGVLVLWELVCRGFGISDFIFPAPSTIAPAVSSSNGTGGETSLRDLDRRVRELEQWRRSHSGSA